MAIYCWTKGVTEGNIFTFSSDLLKLKLNPFLS